VTQEPQEFEGDLNEAVFWGAELKDATFRDVDLTGARITHALVVDVEIDAFVDRLVVNGVDVTTYVNERDEWYPLRAMLRPTTTEEMRAALAATEEAWSATIEQARSRPEASLHESVDGEFSFVETVRHMVFAIDKWFTAPVLGAPFDPMGLPNRGSLDFPWPGLDHASRPTVDEALGVRADRMARLADFLDSPGAEDLDRPVEVLENGPNPLHDCIGVVFEEAFWHNRYARRDLAKLAAG
jgi:hypothetical protein